MTKYQVIDRQTGKVVATLSTCRAANKKVDKMDLAYGAVRYAVRAIDENGTILGPFAR